MCYLLRLDVGNFLKTFDVTDMVRLLFIVYSAIALSKEAAMLLRIYSYNRTFILKNFKWLSFQPTS